MTRKEMIDKLELVKNILEEVTSSEAYREEFGGIGSKEIDKYLTITTMILQRLVKHWKFKELQERRGK